MNFRSHIIQIQPPEGKIFKFPNPAAVSFVKNI